MHTILQHVLVLQDMSVVMMVGGTKLWYNTVSADFCRSQEIDMFGEISGVCFSPEADKFFVGIADATYSSLLQFNRHDYQNLQQHASL